MRVKKVKVEKVSMKLLLNTATKWIAGMFLLVFVCAANPAFAQDARLQFNQLDKMVATKADNVVEVSLDQKLLQVAAKFLSSKNPQEAAVKDLVSNLEGVYVRVFEFDKPGEYSTEDVEPIRSQVNAPGWSKIVGVTSRRQGQKVDVHLRMVGENINGLLIIATEPKELVVVNIVGPIDLEKLRQLEGQFGIPNLELEKIGKGKPRNE